MDPASSAMSWDICGAVDEIGSLCDREAFEEATILLVSLLNKVVGLDKSSIPSVLGPVARRVVTCLVRVGSAKETQEDLMSENYIALWKAYVPFIKAVQVVMTVDPQASGAGGDASLGSVPQVSVSHCHVLMGRLALRAAGPACQEGSPELVEVEALCSLLFFHAQRVLLHLAHLRLEPPDLGDCLEALLAVGGLAAALTAGVGPDGALLATAGQRARDGLQKKSSDLMGRLAGVLCRPAAPAGCVENVDCLGLWAVLAERLAQVRRYGTAAGHHGHFLRGTLEYALLAMTHVAAALSASRSDSDQDAPRAHYLSVLPALLSALTSVVVVALTQLCWIYTQHEPAEASTTPPTVLAYARRFVSAALRVLRAAAASGALSAQDLVAGLKAQLLAHCCGDSFALMVAAAMPLARVGTAAAAAPLVNSEPASRHVARALLCELLVAESVALAVQRQQLAASQTQTSFRGFVEAQHRRVWALVLALLVLAVPDSAAAVPAPGNPAARTLQHVLRVVAALDANSAADGAVSTGVDLLVASLGDAGAFEAGAVCGVCGQARRRLLALLLHESLCCSLAALQRDAAGRPVAVERFLALLHVVRGHVLSFSAEGSATAAPLASAVVPVVRALADSIACGGLRAADPGSWAALQAALADCELCPFLPASGGGAASTALAPLVAKWGAHLATYLAGLCTAVGEAHAHSGPRRLEQVLAAVRATQVVLTGLAGRSDAASASGAARHMLAYAGDLAAAAKAVSVGVVAAAPTVRRLPLWAIVQCVLDTCRPLLLGALQLHARTPGLGGAGQPPVQTTVQSVCRDCCLAISQLQGGSGSGSGSGRVGGREAVAAGTAGTLLVGMLVSVGRALPRPASDAAGAGADAGVWTLVTPELRHVVAGYMKGVTVTTSAGRPSALQLSDKTAAQIALELHASAGAGV